MSWTVSRRSRIAEAQSQSQAVHVGFVVEKVALKQDFLRILWISPVSSVPPMLHSYSFICHRDYITPKIKRFCK